MRAVGRCLAAFVVWAALLAAAVYANATSQRIYTFYGAMTAASEAGFLHTAMVGLVMIALAGVASAAWQIFFRGLFVEDVEKFAVSMLLYYTELLISVVLCHILVGSSVKLAYMVELCIVAVWRLLHLAMVARTETTEVRQAMTLPRWLALPVCMLAVNLMILRVGFATRKRNPQNAHLAHTVIAMSITCAAQIARRILHHIHVHHASGMWARASTFDHRVYHAGILFTAHVMQFANHIGFFAYCLSSLEVPAVNVLRPIYSEFHQAAHNFSTLRRCMTLGRRIDQWVPDATEERFKDDPEPVCAICFENMEFGGTERIKQLYPCGHLFHRHCIVNWFHRSLTCPYCRTKIRKPPRAPTAITAPRRRVSVAPREVGTRQQEQRREPPQHGRSRERVKDKEGDDTKRGGQADNVDPGATPSPSAASATQTGEPMRVSAQPSAAAATASTTDVPEGEGEVGVDAGTAPHGTPPAPRLLSPVATIFMNDGMTDATAAREWARAVQDFVAETERATQRFQERLRGLHARRVQREWDVVMAVRH